MNKDTFYFTHDFNARTDPKIKKLIHRHGIAGYGIFWALVEDLYQNANALPTDYDSIAYDMRTNQHTVKAVINDFGLFVIENGMFSSASVQRRMDERVEKSKKAKESAMARWGNGKNANALPPQSDSNAIKEKKGKELKGKENKDISIKEKSIKENFDQTPVAADGNPNTPPVAAAPPLDFQTVWDLYDKKVGDRQRCEKKFYALSPDDQQKILIHIPQYVQSTPDKQYRTNFETYLNQKRWTNEIILAPVISQSNGSTKRIGTGKNTGSTAIINPAKDYSAGRTFGKTG